MALLALLLLIFLFGRGAHAKCITSATCSGISDNTLTLTENVPSGTTYDCCDTLEKLVLSRGIDSITARAFAKCSSLENIHFNEDSAVTSIGDNAFA